jgi:hypothetical protein
VFGSISLDYEDATSPIAGHLLEHCPGRRIANIGRARDDTARTRLGSPGFTKTLAAAGATDCKDTTV